MSCRYISLGDPIDCRLLLLLIYISRDLSCPGHAAAGAGQGQGAAEAEATQAQAQAAQAGAGAEHVVGVGVGAGARPNGLDTWCVRPVANSEQKLRIGWTESLSLD